MEEKFKNANIIDKRTTYIDDSVIIGKNVKIYPNNQIFGNTIIEDNVTLLPNNCIFDCNIGCNSTITSSYLEHSIIGNFCKIGPYCRIRPGSKIGDNCRLGNFVEIKNSTLGKNCKAGHHA